MIDDDRASRDVCIPEGSVLFVSAHITPDHDNYGMYRPKIDPPPDYDLNRLLETAGRWTRKFFHRTIIEATSKERVYPESPDGLSAVVIGGSLAHLSAARGALASWQEDLIEFVRKCILDWDLGFLGLCGGGQIGLCALGGTVNPNPAGMGTQLENLWGNELVRNVTHDLPRALQLVFDGAGIRHRRSGRRRRTGVDGPTTLAPSIRAFS